MMIRLKDMWHEVEGVEPEGGTYLLTYLLRKLGRILLSLILKCASTSETLDRKSVGI